MILRALYDLAQDEQLIGDPDFEMQPVAWLVRVGEGGRLVGIEGTHQAPVAGSARKPKARPKRFLVPRRPTGKAGTKAPAAFLVENAKYVFGRPTADKPFSKEEGREKSGWFRAAAEQCARATGDPGVIAVCSFLAACAADHGLAALPPEARSNDLFAFIFAPDAGVLVHNRPAVRAYWKASREVRPTDESASTCIVTGKQAAQAGLFPLVKRVPGGQTAGAALVGFNQKAFESHGWEGNENVPVSREAAEACHTALSRLLDPAYEDQQGRKLPRRRIDLSPDTAVCFWARGGVREGFVDALAGLFAEEDAGRVEDLFRSTWTGRAVEVDESAFYALTLSGSQGRIVVRGWFESTVAEVAESVRRHFDDTAVVRNAPPPKDRPVPCRFPLRVLLAGLAPNGDLDQVPAPLITSFVRSALQGEPYPLAVLQRALERARAEIGRSKWQDLERRDARAALIKATLSRLKPGMRIGVAMDPTNCEPGYLLGRLMSVIERLQQLALNPKNVNASDVNASVVDRYFGAASATPRLVFARLLKNTRHHARKAADEPATASTARWLEGQLDAIAVQFHPEGGGFPAHLDLVQQGLFVLGYHHQRHWLWLSKEERERLVSSDLTEARRDS